MCAQHPWFARSPVLSLLCASALDHPCRAACLRPRAAVASMPSVSAHAAAAALTAARLAASGPEPDLSHLPAELLGMLPKLTNQKAATASNAQAVQVCVRAEGCACGAVCEGCVGGN